MGLGSVVLAGGANVRDGRSIGDDGGLEVIKIVGHRDELGTP